MNYFSILLAFLLVLTLPAKSEEGQKTTVEIAGLRFSVPKSWVDAKPLSPMRAAQWVVPAKKGEVEPGEVVAFYFGPGEGGDTQANIQRWLTTMTTPDGGPAQGDTTIRKVAGITVTQVVVFGTYTNAMATPGLPPAPHPGYGLVGAVVEGPTGSIFFRLTGTEDLVKSQFILFTKFIDSLKPTS